MMEPLTCQNAEPPEWLVEELDELIPELLDNTVSDELTLGYI